MKRIVQTLFVLKAAVFRAAVHLTAASGSTMLALFPSTELAAQEPHNFALAEGGMKLQYVDVTTALATGGAATSITLGIPSGARVIGFQAKLTTAVAGIDSTTGTFALTGGNTETIGTIDAFTKNTALQGFTPGGTNFVTSATTNASFTLSGGADNVPTAGAVRMVVWYWTLAELADA